MSGAPGTPAPAVAEFLRHQVADADAHARGIAEMRGRLQQALAAGEALAIVEQAADLAGALTTARQEAEALALLQPHTALAEALPGEEAAGWFWNAHATALQYLGRRGEADASFAKALQLSSDAGWRRLQAMVAHHWGRSLAEQERFDEAQACFEQALALRVALDSPWQASSRRALDALAALRRSPGGA